MYSCPFIYIYFITMVCAVLSLAFSIRTSFSRTNTFEIHSISTSKSLIHLITDDIKNYCIFGTNVPLLNVKSNWGKSYLSIIQFIHTPVSCMLPMLNVKPNWEKVFIYHSSLHIPVSSMQHSLINLI